MWDRVQEMGMSGPGSFNSNTLEAARKVTLKLCEHRTGNTKRFADELDECNDQ